jgi:hypothetical protein
MAQQNRSKQGGRGRAHREAAPQTPESQQVQVDGGGTATATEATQSIPHGTPDKPLQKFFSFNPTDRSWQETSDPNTAHATMFDYGPSRMPAWKFNMPHELDFTDLITVMFEYADQLRNAPPAHIPAEQLKMVRGRQPGSVGVTALEQMLRELIGQTAPNGLSGVVSLFSTVLDHINKTYSQVYAAQYRNTPQVGGLLEQMLAGGGPAELTGMGGAGGDEPLQ